MTFARILHFCQSFAVYGTAATDTARGGLPADGSLLSVGNKLQAGEDELWVIVEAVRLQTVQSHGSHFLNAAGTPSAAAFPIGRMMRKGLPVPL